MDTSPDAAAVDALLGALWDRGGSDLRLIAWSTPSMR